MDTSKFKNGKSSGARTSLGLNYGERWTAREFVSQAVEAGARLLTRAECTDIIVKYRIATGVKVRLKNGKTESFYGENIIVSAGGIPTSVLLKRAGIESAGQGCVMAPVLLVYGIHPD